jgi:hypothetical protein
MNTQREIRLQAIVAALAGIGTPVYRSRAVALLRGELPAVVVKPSGEQPEKIGNGVTKRPLEVDCEIHVRGDVPDQLADPIAGAIHAALMSAATLGGPDGGVIERETVWEYADADQTAAVITLKYQFVYLTAAADLTRSV